MSAKELKMREICSSATVGSSENLTILDELYHHVCNRPNHQFLIWVDSQCKVVKSLTYEKLWKSAHAVVGLLQQHNIQKGDRVMVSYLPGAEFMAGLFGCMLAGVIPCSVYPPDPSDKRKAKYSFDQFNNQVADAEAKLALTSISFKRILSGAGFKGLQTNVKWIVTDHLSGNEAFSSDSRKLKPNFEACDIAFIQYSSGSTSSPKGIKVSHGALLHNLNYALALASRSDHEEYRFAAWLPQYHDYGLILAFLMAIHTERCPLVAFSPLNFIKNPLLWADVIEKFEVTHIAGPNFGYALLAKRMKAAGRTFRNSKLVRVNISAEPIATETLNSLVDIGIPYDTLNPSYGLAESCACVASSLADDIRELDGIISVGNVKQSLAYGVRFAVVNPQTRELIKNGNEGEILLHSPSLASGYWNKPDLDCFFSVITMDGYDYFATGDLGKIVDGRLYICGRLKEIIIINGKNIYPTDLERTIESEYPSIIRPGSTIAYQDSDFTAGLVLEIRDTALKKDWEGLTPTVLRELIRSAHGIETSCIYILKQGTVPKTTSGKLCRVETKKICLEDRWPKQKMIQQLVAHQHLQDKETFDNGGKNAATDFSSVLRPFFGPDDVHENSRWDELGMTSMSSLNIRDSIERSFNINLPSNCFETFATVSSLKNFVLDHAGNEVETKPKKLLQNSSRKLPWTKIGIFQVIGIFLNLMLFAVSIIPAWYLGKWFSSSEMTESVKARQQYIHWMWIPLVIPAFIFTFSFLVICIKWLVVGRYQQQEMHVRSVAYLRWWFVDRAIDMWERWVGHFLRDTIALWVFYRLMGAKIHPTAKLDAFVREFDLIEIGRLASVEQTIRCKRFGPWEGDDGPTLKLRQVVLKQKSCVRGILGPGAVVGMCSKVEKCSVVPECGFVKNGWIVKGNPAFYSEENNESKSVKKSWFLEATKMLWLLVELYNFMALVLFNQFIFSGIFPTMWHYSPLCYWTLYLVVVFVMLVFESILLKWCFVGKRHAGPTSKTKIRKAALWTADYHYRLAISNFIFDSTRLSRLVPNSILKLMGMKIDYKSLVVMPEHILPSKVDLINVECSLVSPCTFDVEKDGELCEIEVINTSIGRGSHLKAGITLEKMLIPPKNLVESEMVGEQKDHRVNMLGNGILLDLYLQTFHCSMYIVVFFSLVPCYNLWTKVFIPQQVFTAVPVLALLCCLQTLVWVVLLILLQYMTNGFRSKQQAKKGCPTVLYVIDHAYNVLVQKWSFLALFHGTPVFNIVAQSLGTTIEGHALLFPRQMQDWLYLTIRDGAVVDDAILHGHFGVFQELTIGPLWISGIIHEGTLVAAGANIYDKETGPLAAVLNPDANYTPNAQGMGPLSLPLGGSSKANSMDNAITPISSNRDCQDEEEVFA